MKVVIDSNNLVSAQINPKGASRVIYRCFLQGEITVYTSPFQLSEFKKALSYKRIKQKFKLSQADIQKILRGFKKYAAVVYPTRVVPVVFKDPDDDQILAIAVEAKADYVISGDSHLVKLDKYQDIPIVTAQEFVLKIY